MRCVLGLGLWMAFASNTLAQTGWVDAGMPTLCYNISTLVVDAVDEVLYAVGVNQDSLFLPTLPYYDGSTWHQLSGFEGVGISTAIRWGDTLVVGGTEFSIGGVPAGAMAGLTNGGWIPFGQFDGPNGATVNRLRMVDGELYALGTFKYADSTVCYGLAKRHGGKWVNVGDRSYPPGLEPNLFDICSYQGKLVVAGLITPIDGLGPNIIQFNGTAWENVGNGIAGCPGSISALEVYHDELYVGGGLMVSAGAVGHGLVRWNGSQWHDVGGNLHDLVNSTNYNASANCFLVHEDKLYVGGSFSYACGLEANRFAIWDGSSWCVTGDSIDSRVQTMAIYHDTLYVNCRDNLHYAPSNFVARWNGGPLEDTCALAVGLQESPMAKDGIRAYQRSDGQVHLVGLDDTVQQWQLLDPAGREVGAGQLKAMNGHAYLPLLTCNPGLYIIVVRSGILSQAVKLALEDRQ